MKQEEVLWFIGTITFVFILNFTLFGVDGLKSDATTNVSIHDTYFIVHDFYLIIFVSIFSFFTSYLFRIIKCNFKNRIANFIFMISGLLCICVFTKLILGINAYIEMAKVKEDKVFEIHDMFYSILIVLYVVQIIIVGLLFFVGFSSRRLKAKKEIN